MIYLFSFFLRRTFNFNFLNNLVLYQSFLHQPVFKFSLIYQLLLLLPSHLRSYFFWVTAVLRKNYKINMLYMVLAVAVLIQHPSFNRESFKFRWVGLFEFFKKNKKIAPLTLGTIKLDMTQHKNKAQSYYTQLLPNLNNILIKSLSVLNRAPSLSNLVIKFQPSDISKLISSALLNDLNINFLRKNKVFNKGRYSRNRQNYRTGVYWSIYVNIIAVVGLYFWFYRFNINFGYLWPLFFLFIFTVFWSRWFSLFFFKEGFLVSLYKDFFWLSSVLASAINSIQMLIFSFFKKTTYHYHFHNLLFLFFYPPLFFLLSFVFKVNSQFLSLKRYFRGA